ncbi:gliding motility protein SprC [Flavobacterium sp. LHD-80]|uniref:gliding motility protein SprC n=1 Tax=Flavobacterium sp. LHD-80 TaxID=3071411 RepID=UPI0027E0AC47|nr:gliding motility protein SprC [Flavobacterium sp. LHD-80]MDQ6469912.1 gliding motility protein SprC [Flavobacterium sp. LHD-80]
MIQKTTLSLIRFFLFFSIFLCTKTNTHAQTIVPQQLDGLEKLCAGSSFNEFYATFSYVNFPAGTTFVIELLDNANTPISTTLLGTPVDVSATQQTIKFAVPVNLTGSETYGMRVKSSTGFTSTRFKNSLGATSFPAYYKEYESKFSINNKGINAAICSSGSITLSVDNDTPTIPASSPANYPNLKYKWYKDNIVITGQTSKTLTVNAVGDYFVVIDYGACSDVNISSNHVNVVSSSSGSATTVTSSLGNPFCANGTGTVLTATSGNSYIWRKDGTVINGATTRNYTTNESGTYTVEVDFGGCKATGSINLSSNGFNASIDVADEVKLDEGETITVSVTTDATSPTYEWFLNENLITGATSNSYLVAAVGNYKVKISQVSGCIATKEFLFKITGPAPPTTVIPNIVSLSGSYPYWNIPDVYKNANTKLMIISSNGEMMFNDVGSNYDPQVNSFIKDFKNVNPVYYYVIQSDTGEKKGSITVIK